jgi:tetratricopeptide (TPR) repeat protein
MKQLSITFLAIGAVLVLWASGVGLSDYLSKEPTRRYLGENHAAVGNGEVPVRGKLPSVDTKSLEKSYVSNPDSLETSISFANALFEEGISEGNAESLKRAVGLYHEILEKSPEQVDALLGLGTLSLHVGVSDKAIEYYERYLVVRPDDKAIIANLALAEGRSGKTEQALGRLSKILGEEPDFVIGLVTKGLILSEQGSVEDAVTLWVKAESLETSETLKNVFRD